MTPTDEQLRQFLAGTLPADQAGGVAAWVESDPSAGDRLAVLDDANSLGAALRRGRTPFPAGDRAEQSLADLAAELDPELTAGRAGPTDDYRVIRELGRGGMGVVVEAEDVRLRRRVAMKRMLPELAERPDAKARFLREARAMAAVESDHIVPVLHVGEAADGTPYLVMPLLTGETLADRLEAGPLAADELRAVARDTATGLAAAHAKGLIHRDIKPSNLWLEPLPDGTLRRVRVLDFGLARPADAAGVLTASRVVVGTPKYMSPEQARGDAVGPESDLFSLGSVLYRAATDRPPFDGETVTAVLTSLAVDEPPPVRTLAPAVPAPLAELIHDLLRKPAGERPTADDVVRRLAGGRPERRRPRWVAAAVGVAAALAAAAAGVIVIKSGKTEVELADGVKAKVSQDGDRTVVEIVPKNPAAPKVEPAAEPKPIPAAKPAPRELPPFHGPLDETWVGSVKDQHPDQQVRLVVAELLRRNKGAAKEDFNFFKDRDGFVAQARVWTDAVADVTPLRALPDLTALSLACRRDAHTFRSLSQLKGFRLTYLSLSQQRAIRDLSHLRGLPLEELDLNSSPATDLAPLAEMPLRALRLTYSAVADLTPIRGLKLKQFDYSHGYREAGFAMVGPLRDLAPLNGMPLESMRLGPCLVRDLTPLTVAALKKCILSMPFQSLERLRGAGIEELSVFEAERHVDVLKSLPNLQRVSTSRPGRENRTPAKLFAELDADTARDREFLTTVGVLKGRELVAAVKAEMERRERDVYKQTLPKDWELPMTAEFDGDNVVALALTSRSADLGPLAAFKSLRKVTFNETPTGGLWPLAALPVTALDFRSGVEGAVEFNLAALGAMFRLETVNGQPYAEFCKEHGIVPTPRPPADLAPAPRPAATLAPDAEWEWHTKRLPRAEQIKAVHAELRKRNPTARAEDFVIETIRTNDCPDQLLVARVTVDGPWDLAPLRGLRQLDRVYLQAFRQPKAFDDLTPLRDLPITGLDLMGLLGVTDLTALKGMPLTFLGLTRSPVRDLTPLAGLPLRTLRLSGTAVTDLTPIRGLKLTYLDYSAGFDPNTSGFGGFAPGGLSSLEPLKDMPLERLDLGDCTVHDFRPVPTARLKTVSLRQSFQDLSPLAGSGIETLQLHDAFTHLDFVKSLPKLAKVSATAPYLTEAPPRKLFDAVDHQNRLDGVFFATTAKLSGEKLTAAVEAEMGARTRLGYERLGAKPPGEWVPKLEYEQADGKVSGVTVVRAGLDLTPLAAFRDARKLTLAVAPSLTVGFRHMASLPLEELEIQEGLPRAVAGHRDTLGRMATLKKINGRPYADFCKEHGIVPAKPK